MLWLIVAPLALALAYFALLDGWYLVRVPCAVLRARLLQPPVRDLLAEQRFAGRVLPSDLDLLLHMNNARYMREADVARAAHLARCGVLGALRALGARAVLAASCARYRRSLRLLEPFEVQPPELPEDLKHWIAYNEASSQQLRTESGLGYTKDQ
ncbi:protein THEM6 isoform 2-T2 [Rhynchocyon petersi]